MLTIRVVPTTLLPLSILSLPSLLSTLSSLLLVLIILIDGFSKSTSPGSLLHPEPTNFGPEWTHGNWLGGIGLILAGFGGHAVVPGLARDMKHPEHFDRVGLEVLSDMSVKANGCIGHQQGFRTSRSPLGVALETGVNDIADRGGDLIRSRCGRVPHDRQRRVG